MKIILAIAGLALASASAARDIQDFRWMSGAWVSESKGEWVEEVWTAPRGGMMLGTNRSGNEGKATGFEFMRIAADKDGRPTFWASPSGKEAVPFRMFSSGPNQVAFENPANDYPTRIAYRRVGGRLHAVISGPGGKKTMTWTFKRPRTK